MSISFYILVQYSSAIHCPTFAFAKFPPWDDYGCPGVSDKELAKLQDQEDKEQAAKDSSSGKVTWNMYGSLIAG
ncbi:MAG: hypothetical protein WA667_06850 [Candidatus Nitrosopolaris sp.]